MQEQMRKFTFADIDGNAKEITINIGDTLFVVGPNGSGKSSLMQKFHIQHRPNTKRISAHRQTWFTSSTLEMTPRARKETAQSIDNADNKDQARWRDDYAAARLSAEIFDLINADNVRSRRITDKIDLGALEEALSADPEKKVPQIVLDALQVKKEEAPLKALNRFLKSANLPIEIFIENDEQLFAKRKEGIPYSIEQLSDGERNAVLICASVITAEPGTVIIIDEPERHLHRSIISPLLSTLFKSRSDCVFVISTHDVFLAADNNTAITLLVRACKWKKTSASGWDTDLLLPDADMTEDIRRAILGARRTVLFIEGNSNSLDEQIYRILFDEISTIPKGSSSEVERATKGVRGLDALHWVTAYGLIDPDDRTPEQLAELRQNGIYGLDCYSVESLYYHPDIISRAARIQADVTGESSSDLEQAAKLAVIESFVEHKERLCARMVERKIGYDIVRRLPNYKFIRENDSFNDVIDLRSYREAEHKKFDEFVSCNNLIRLIARYPLRETPLRDRVAKKLNFQDETKYEMAVRKLLLDDEESRAVLKASLDDLAALLDA